MKFLKRVYNNSEIIESDSDDAIVFANIETGTIAVFPLTPEIIITNEDCTSSTGTIKLTCTTTKSVKGDIVWTCDYKDATINGDILTLSSYYNGPITLKATANN